MTGPDRGARVPAPAGIWENVVLHRNAREAGRLLIVGRMIYALPIFAMKISWSVDGDPEEAGVADPAVAGEEEAE